MLNFKRFLALLMAAALAVMFFSSCTEAPESTGTTVYEDSCGRMVEIPNKLTKVAPSGQVAQMMIYAVKPDTLVGLSIPFTDTASAYIDEQYKDLPIFGQFYGKNANLNMEALISAEPQIIIDMGDMKSEHKEDMDSLQEQTGIPVIFIEAGMETYGNAIAELADLLGTSEHGAELKAYIDDTLSFAQGKRNEITDANRVGVYFGTGVSGLEANAAGNFHAQVLDIVGVENVTKVDEVSSKGGGNVINMEQLYEFAPDVIILSPDGAYDMVLTSSEWGELEAVQNQRVYQIPTGPYNFLADPPSANRIIGIWWLGHLVYPDLYDIDMISKTKEFYSLFWHYELTDAQANEILNIDA